MRCGVLCDKDGKVKRTWALISDTATVPVEDGDHVIEWEVDHGEDLPHSLKKLSKIKAAVREQEIMPAFRTQADLLAHGEKYQHAMTAQQVVIGAPSIEPIYYGAGKGLHHRRVNGDGDVVDVPRDEAEGHMEEVVPKGKSAEKSNQKI